MKRTAILASMLVTVSLQAAEPRQNPAKIGHAVDSFLQREASGLPGQVRIEVGKIDPRVSLTACLQLQTFFPPGSRAWGQTTVGVRCADPSTWTLYVPAMVSVTGNYLAASRSLAAGQEITAADLSVQEADLTQLPAGTMTEVSQVIGRRLANSVRAGQPLRRDAVREPPAVVQGQLVGLIINGPGFRIRSEGHSLGKAPEGERVQVKTLAGGVVSGIVRAGAVVEVIN